MPESEAFPGRSVVNSYVAAEELLGGMLDVVPYCRDHENVWSPRLVTVLLESCSQLDSLWAWEARQSPCVQKKKFRITDYFGYFGEYVGHRWLVFWGEEPQQVRPFAEWDSLPKYTQDDYVALDWWDAYNKLKHDRLTYRREATLKRAVHALAGLFLAILRCEYCRDGIAEAGWLASDARNPQAWLGEDSPSTAEQFIVAESTLFSYPVGWCNRSINSQTTWKGPASLRFRRWFGAYEQE